MTTPTANPNSIVVRGGEGPKLPPLEREIDGTPDPELARMVAEGATRYHLETLRSLAADDDEVKRSIAAELDALGVTPTTAQVDAIFESSMAGHPPGAVDRKDAELAAGRENGIYRVGRITNTGTTMPGGNRRARRAARARQR